MQIELQWKRMEKLKRKFKQGYQQMCRVQSLRNALQGIAKLPTQVTLPDGRKVFAVIYTQRYEESVKYLVNHYNDGSLDIYNPKSIKEFGEGHVPVELQGYGENGRRREAEIFMDFIKNHADIVEEKQPKRGKKNGKDNHSSK